MLVSIVNAQHSIHIEATLQPESKSVQVTQGLAFVNTSSETLTELYLHDWANSFSSKTTPLAKRFAENYSSSFHFEKNEDRGRTNIHSIVNAAGQPLTWERTEADIIKVTLIEPLVAAGVMNLKMQFTVILPKAKFTRYGAAKNGDFKLRYWYLSPAIYDGKWQVYSNKNLDDLYASPSTFNIKITAPNYFKIVSDLDERISEECGNQTITSLIGENRIHAKVQLRRLPIFETIATDKLAIITNLEDKKIRPEAQALSVDRIVHFLNEKLGPYPHRRLMSAESAYKSSPVYGLNQLPDFISPFPQGFEYDMEQLKTISHQYIKNTLTLHPREDYWLQGALQIYLMMEYVDIYYPNMKIMGSFSEFWVIRWSHASELEFNDQYPLLYLNMARSNLHQSLTTPKDSLLKFNKNIANDYYAGDGLNYLADYIGKEALDIAIKEFVTEHSLQNSKASSFQKKIEAHTDLPVQWFFEEYVGKRTLIDFKIKQVKKLQDSLVVDIKNMENTTMPVSIYGLNEKYEVIFKKWLAPFDSISTITLPRANVKRLALNFEDKIPEINSKNNYKSLNGLLNRPVQFRLFQDLQDSKYNQLFFMPEFGYNLYDGFSPGIKLYNKTVLPKDFHYSISPGYGFRSKEFNGGASLVYTNRISDDSSLYFMRYGVAGSKYSYDTGLFYKRYSPFMTFAFRNKDLRNNEKQFINIRNVNVSRDENPNDPNQEPNYSVFNAQYVYSNPNLINYFRSVVDYQISSQFSKLSTTFTFRKLFLNNRQLNIRVFAGAFLFNHTPSNENFFSFALDRPTDYLFDYNYYGRSEDAGLFSQQLIIAEGGFKSQLEPAFANSWITTINASTNIWNWVYAYGDGGLIHNKGQGTQAVFDTGIRLSLVADYFELFFPLYSNLGWEPGLPDYDQKIRFIVTLSPSTLLGLFTREWY
jgi:hypothetical protein